MSDFTLHSLLASDLYEQSRFGACDEDPPVFDVPPVGLLRQPEVLHARGILVGHHDGNIPWQRRSRFPLRTSRTTARTIVDTVVCVR